MKSFVILLLGFVFTFASPSFAWDGYDYNTNSYVQIDKDNLVREGEDIEVYDYDSGEYRDMSVESIDSYGGGVELEVYDNESGEYRTFEMDD